MNWFATLRGSNTLPPSKESVVDLQTLLNNTSEPRIEKETCYDYMKLSGIDYGNAFKVVDVVYRGEEEGSRYAIGQLEFIRFIICRVQPVEICTQLVGWCDSDLIGFVIRCRSC